MDSLDDVEDIDAKLKSKQLRLLKQLESDFTTDFIETLSSRENPHTRYGRNIRQCMPIKKKLANKTKLKKQATPLVASTNSKTYITSLLTGTLTNFQETIARQPVPHNPNLYKIIRGPNVSNSSNETCTSPIDRLIFFNKSALNRNSSDIRVDHDMTQSADTSSIELLNGKRLRIDIVRDVELEKLCEEHNQKENAERGIEQNNNTEQKSIVQMDCSLVDLSDDVDDDMVEIASDDCINDNLMEMEQNSSDASDACTAEILMTVSTAETPMVTPIPIVTETTAMIIEPTKDDSLAICEANIETEMDLIQDNTPSSDSQNEVLSTVTVQETENAEEENEITCEDGDLVWAAIGKFPYWPAIVCKSEDGELTLDDKVHIKFLSDNGRVSWVNKKRGLLRFTGLDDFNKQKDDLSSKLSGKRLRTVLKKYTASKENNMWKAAVEEGELLFTFPITDRYRLYSDILLPFLMEAKYPHLVKKNKLNDDFDFDYASHNRHKTSTPCTFDTAYSSMKQSMSPISINQDFDDQFQQEVCKTKRIENYLQSIADNEHIDVVIEDDDAISTSTKSSSLPSDPEEGSIERLKNLIQKRFHYDSLSSDEEIIRRVSSILDLQSRKRLDCKSIDGDSKQKSSSNKVKTKPKDEKIDITKQRAEKRRTSDDEVIKIPNSIGNATKRQKTLRKKVESSVKTVKIEKNNNNSEEVRKELERKRNEKKAELEERRKETILSFIMKTKPQNYLFKGLRKDVMCRICLKPNNVLRCSGACAGYYHAECLDNPAIKKPNDWYEETHSANAESGENDVKTHVTGDESISTNNFETAKSTEFLCKYCASSKKLPCFVCNKDDDELLRCSERNCGKYYHKKCLKYWPQHKYSYSGNKMTLLCPCHVCQICISENPRALFHNTENDKKLIKCMLCPGTYHRSSCCIPAGSELLSESQLVCPRHRVNKRAPVNTNWCFICLQGGSLICCETCPTSFHQECLKIQTPDPYICEECESGRLPLYGEIVWSKLGTYKWWPAIIVPPTEIPDSLLREQQVKKYYPNYFCVYFFGSYNYSWLCRDYVYLYQEDDTTSKDDSDACRRAIQEAIKVYKMIKDTTTTHPDPKSNHNSRPLPYRKIKNNRAIPPVKFENDLEHNEICCCRPNDPNACGAESNCLNRHLFIECSSTCPAGDKCQNRNFEKRIYPKVKVVLTESKGWGLIALEDIPANAFIIEYVGEVINGEEFDRRFKRMVQNKDQHFYFLSMENNLYIDAGPCGNDARFINHSCDPNCVPQKWNVNGHMRIGLFSSMDISKGTELTFNYNWMTPESPSECSCGSYNCAGFIGGKRKKADEIKGKKRKSSL